MKMGNEIAYLMPTKYKIFLGKGALPPYNPRQGASPLDQAANTSLTDCHSYKHAQRLGDSRGNLKLVQAWSLWWKWYGEFITKLCEFYPLKQVFLDF